MRSRQPARKKNFQQMRGEKKKEKKLGPKGGFLYFTASDMCV